MLQHEEVCEKNWICSALDLQTLQAKDTPNEVDDEEGPSTPKKKQPLPLRIGEHSAQTKLFYILTVPFAQDLPQRKPSDTYPDEAPTLFSHLSKTCFECLTLPLSANPIYYKTPFFRILSTAEFRLQYCTIIWTVYHLCFVPSVIVTSTCNFDWQFNCIHVVNEEFKFDSTHKLKGIEQ